MLSMSVVQHQHSAPDADATWLGYIWLSLHSCAERFCAAWVA